jgi:hypothetical protein
VGKQIEEIMWEMNNWIINVKQYLNLKEIEKS